MGWKNIKNHYGIKHHVHVTEAGVCIGSPYISDIIVIAMDGTIAKRYADRSNEDLRRYQAEFDADPAKLLELLTTPDTFEKSIPVYTYDGATILEKKCEELSWPNTTHEGEMMFDNTHSADRDQVVRWAKRNAAAGVRMYARMVAEQKAQLERLERDGAQSAADLEALNASYPQVPYKDEDDSND